MLHAPLPLRELERQPRTPQTRAYLRRMTTPCDGRRILEQWGAWRRSGGSSCPGDARLECERAAGGWSTARLRREQAPPPPAQTPPQTSCSLVGGLPVATHAISPPLKQNVSRSVVEDPKPRGSGSTFWTNHDHRPRPRGLVAAWSFS
ncbi:unnamed protein product [Lota lota]